MNLLVFPSISNPQFYLSKNENVISFFIHNFLFSGRLKIQLIINTLTKVLPDSFILFLLEIMLVKENKMPHELLESIEEVKGLIHKNRELFLMNFIAKDDVHFIIRKSAWQRKDDKFVIILFTGNNKQPFAVAKAGTLKHRNSIELEFNNTKTVYEKFKNSEAFVVPEPISFHTSDKMAVYFERVIGGVPFNNYLKLIFSRRTKQNCYIYVLNKCKDLLISLGSKKEALTSDKFMKYFYDPIEDFRKTGLGNKYSFKLNQLKEQADGIKNKLYSVYMHGDLWGGSVLYNNGQIGIIDWEFLTTNGVPMWDFFSIAFHAGAEINKNSSVKLSDFMNYFDNIKVSENVDCILNKLADSFQIETAYIPFLFQIYLLFNIKNRDTESERYWQDCLEYYWGMSDACGAGIRRLL